MPPSPRSTMPKIALEEAISWPQQFEQEIVKLPIEEVLNELNGRLTDITGGQREKEMRENNIIMQIISPTAPGLQRFHSKSKKSQIKQAQFVNNYMAKKIKGRAHFAAFATLPMRDPQAACVELERCVKDLHMVGAMVNGNDFYNGRVLFYDTPEYDPLWAKFVELDVPLYLHPLVYGAVDGTPDNHLSNFFDEYPFLAGSAWGFSMYTAQHVMKLIVSGVFDRHKKLKLILGHMGEILPWWAERFDHRLRKYKSDTAAYAALNKGGPKIKPLPLPQRLLTDYLRTNIWVTTSGWFSDAALAYVVSVMGVDRVMFSIDYPFEDQYAASEWLDKVPMPERDKKKIAYKNAMKLLRL
jgi:predicted TIM-barrel fold metal-dependent hydrolase